MKKIKEKTPKLNTAAKKSSSKTSKSKSQESHVEANTSSKLQSKRSANLSQQSETEIVGDIISRNGMEMALQESEEAFRTLAETVPQIVWATRADGSNIFFNQQWVEYTGLTLEESYGHGWNIPFHPDDKQRAWDAWQNATKHGATYSLEVRLQRADGIYRWWLVRGAPLLDTTGKIINWFGTCTDIDDLKQAERRQTLSTKILGILNNPASMDDAISKIITTLKRETGFDAIGIRLQRGDDFPYFSQDGFSKEFILAENTLAVRAEDGGVCVDKDGNVCLECTCGMVISGKTDPTNPIFTPTGSCWTNESCARADHPIADERLHPRDRCIHEGYHSVALIPLRADKRIVGILQLNDHRPNQFTLAMISFLEDMGALIGIAVARKRAEDELEAANRELEERVTARTADLNRTNEQLRQEVGERRRVEDRLRQSEMRMERAQEIAHLGSWELDLVSNHLSWSDEVYRIFGLQPQEFGATYEAFLDRVHPDDRAAVDSAYSGSLREGRDSYEIEHRVVRKSDGEIRIVHEKCEHFRNESGTIIRSIGMVHDITERKLAEEALRESEEQFRALTENLQSGVALIDEQGAFKIINHAFRRIFEISEDFDILNVNDQDWGQWQVFDERGALLNVNEHPVRKAALMGKALRNQVVAVKSPVSATLKWLLVSAEPIFDAQGSLHRLICTYYDFTGRKAVEEQIAQSRKTLAELIERAPFGIYIVDSQFCISLMNIGSQEGTFRNVRPVIGRNFAEAMHILWQDEVAEEIIGHFRYTLKTGEPYYSPRFVNPRHDVGIVESYEWELHRITLPDSQSGVICYYFDSTALRQAEEALRRSEARWNSAIENFAEGAIIASEDEQVVYWNPAARAMHGFTHPDEGIEPLEKTPMTFQLWLPDGSRMLEFDEWPMRRIKRGETVQNLELRIRRPDQGWEKVFTYSGAMVETSSGERLIFLSCYDLTELRQVERTIAVLNADLTARNEELEFSNKELESFIYSVSHDLRAPLRHISGFSDLLKKNIAGKLDEKGQRYFSLIQDASEKMSRLIDDLLNLSRISRQEISRTEVDMSVIVGSIIKDLREAQPNRSVEVDIKEGLTAFADSGLIEVALSNLLGNSWKFTAKTEHARIEFGSVEQDGKIFYCVRDNGVGFDQQYAGKMFWPFHRLHSEAAFEGTGIGLAIVDRIIRCHGGKIWAEGIEGKGAKICFSLA